MSNELTVGKGSKKKNIESPDFKGFDVEERAIKNAK
jgi:hypothetical protein